MAAKELKSVINHQSTLADEPRESFLQRLMEDKRQVESDEIKLSNLEHKSILIGMLWDAIILFAHKKFGVEE